MLVNLTGDIALVTGAAGGIGRAVAVALASAGARVVCADVVALDDVMADISTVNGEARAIPCDLAGTDGWRVLLTEAQAAFGPVSILVHSASPHRVEAQTVLHVSENEWDAMVNVNLRSGFFLAREVARGMKEAKIAGRILFMASLHAHTPRNLPHYSASKAGQVMVVKELARALAPDGIRVNALAPGAIPGGGFAGDFTALSEMIPMGRPGTPQDVAAAALALLDPGLAYVTGAVLPVDGAIDTYNWLPRSADP